MKKFFVVAAFFVVLSSWSYGQGNLIPTPRSVDVLGDKMVSPGRKVVKIIDGLGLPAEGYRLSIGKSRIDIEASDERGAVWAERTLEQLYVDGRLPQVRIEDYPAFGVRAFMHDTGRNFVEVPMIKEHIDLMSRYKLNVFQWHLTDNPAWRIESKAYPQLNDARYQRKGRDEGKFYTYDEIRDVIAYAKARGVMVIPEIDMPGHSKFFNDTFGFSMDSKEGMAVLEKCLDEFFAEIPVEMAPYFHVGSDEVHVADPRGFMEWSESQMRKHNRRAVAWDPGLPSAPTTIRQIWNEDAGANSGAADKPGDYIDSFMGYLNFYDPMVYTNRLLLHTPCAVSEPRPEALGGALCLWNDVNVDDKSKLMPHNGAVNGILAFAERFWGGGEFGDTKEVANINVLPAPNTATGKELSAFEQKMIYHRDNYLRGQNMRWVANSHIPWSLAIDTAHNATIIYSVYGGAVDMDEFTKLHKIKVKAPMVAEATTTIIAPCDTVITAWVGFDTPARSNRIGVGIGEQGKWEAGGQLLVNGSQINPAKAWNEPGAYAFHFHTWHKPEEEFAYTDEQFYWMREPVAITLKKGENKITMKSPKTFDGQRWSFAFIPVSVDAEGEVHEVQNITYKY